MHCSRWFLALALCVHFSASADPELSAATPYVEFAYPAEEAFAGLPAPAGTGAPVVADTLRHSEEPGAHIDAVDVRAWLPQLKQAGQSVGAHTNQLIATAMSLVGVPYRRGGTNAATGFDCSGFVRTVYAEALGHALPRVARDQAKVTTKIKKDELRPGDLVFFNTMRRAFSHVGIYVGDGQFIHAPRPGASIRVESMRSGYWSKRFNGARRVPVEISTPLENAGNALVRSADLALPAASYSLLP